MITRSEKKLFPKAIILIIFIIVLGFLNYKGVLDPFKNLVARLVLSGSGEVRTGTVNTQNKLAAFFSLSEILKENEKNQELELKVQTLEQGKNALAQENESLRNQLNLLPQDKFKLIGLDVIGQDPDAPQEFILVNKGEQEGIKKGQPIIFADRVLVGRVYETMPHQAKILLTVSPLSVLSAELAKEQVAGIAKGQYNLEIGLNLIPNQTPLNPEDLIVTSGNNHEFPAGLLIGKVKTVSQSADGLFQQAIIKPFYTASDLKVVFAIES